ncbi:MAG: sensor histidine kinase [Spirochaetales bacterium]|nr:sensor histidine kinase [Spirochaetales bacterium]
MAKERDKTKIKIFNLGMGVTVFLLFTIGTVINGNLDNDYINFKLFKNHFNVNSDSLINNSKLSLELRNPGLEKTINELDLNFFIFRAESLLSAIKTINKKYRLSWVNITNSWIELVENYNDDSFASSFKIEKLVMELTSELESMNNTLLKTVKIWKFSYMLLLAINLLVFIYLLIYVTFLDSNGDGTNTKGITNVRNALIQGQEQERLRISLELHDKVAQDLFACRMIINDITTVTTDQGIINSFDKAISLLDSSIKEVRDLSYSLRPPALQAIGLDSAFKSYIDNFSKKIEIPITYKAIGVTNKKIDETVSINLYRILQETLNNTAKHAHAENIDIKLIYTHPFLLLKIEDNGVGFRYVKSEMKAKGRNKLGLPGISERVSLLGGELIINTEKGEGTKILIKVPVDVNEKL